MEVSAGKGIYEIDSSFSANILQVLYDDGRKFLNIILSLCNMHVPSFIFKQYNKQNVVMLHSLALLGIFPDFGHKELLNRICCCGFLLDSCCNPKVADGLAGDDLATGADTQEGSIT